MRRHNPVRHHVRAHFEVIGNEDWYGDGVPFVGGAFTSTKTAERQAAVIDLIERRAAKADRTGDRKLARSLWRLAKQLQGCRRSHRCGSLACPNCVRAFQRAKTAAQKLLIAANKSRVSKTLVMATVIPLSFQYLPAGLGEFDVVKNGG